MPLPSASFNPAAYQPGELNLPITTPGGAATGVGNGNQRAGTAGSRNQGSPSGAGGQPVTRPPSTSNQNNAEKYKVRKSDLLKDVINADLKYPATAAGGYYLNFQIYDYKSAQALAVQDIRQGLIKGSAGLTNIFTNIFSADADEGQGLTPNSGTDPTANSKKSDIFLYVPSRLEYNYGAGWNKVSFGALGNAIGQGATDLGAAIGSGLSTAANSFTNDVLNKVGDIPKIEGVSLDSVLGGAFGVTFNDNTLQTFDRMSPRSFTFEYMLLARNPSEEQTIKKIITKFKHAMHPGARRSANNVSLLLDYPYIFRIIPGNEKLSQYIPKTKYCALTRMSVDYTPNNIFNPTPGSFVHSVRMSLNFEELTTLTQEDILSDNY